MGLFVDLFVVCFYNRTAQGPFSWRITGALTMSNPLWEPAVAALAKSAADLLGVPGVVEARPSHLHLVGSGSAKIDAPHAVAANGAFGVLVLVLPAVHEGGRLEVAHGGKVKTLDAAGELKACTVPTGLVVCVRCGLARCVAAMTDTRRRRKGSRCSSQGTCLHESRALDGALRHIVCTIYRIYCLYIIYRVLQSCRAVLYSMTLRP